jgi:SAM-dependent methyltransferase
MQPSSVDPTQRFSDRVEHYARYRPDYPPEVLSLLQGETGLTPHSIIADLGSGTGISSLLFLRHSNSVYGVEPNAAMRQAAERLLADQPLFHSIAGTAENTTLADHSVDYAVAAQAFHWFDIPQTKRELQRILRPQGFLVLLWNTRRIHQSSFLQDYEALLQEFGTDYQQVRHDRFSTSDLQALFSTGYTQHTLPHEQTVDLAGAKGRLQSSSYVPAPGDPRHQPMLRRLEEIVLTHAKQGRVRFLYDTELYFGHLT